MPAATLPTTLRGHFRRRAPAYSAGCLVLLVFQVAMNRIDWLSKSAIDQIFGPTPALAWRPAAWILGLAMVAFVGRVSSRWFIFNAGRDVEYEVRTVLLTRRTSSAQPSIGRCPPARS
jgi:ATP-binding cassette subfamily B protein